MENCDNEQITGIDLSFRPHNYFWAQEMHVRLPGQIMGTLRKAWYEQSLETGESVPEALIESTLSDDLRKTLGRIHPHFMGGEYLTQPKQKEVVLARMTINSTTADTYIIYVHRSGNRHRYRAADEYDGTSLCNPTKRSSVQPLTLGALVDFAMRAWGVREVLEMNFEEEGYPAKDCHDFLVDVSSDFYPDFWSAMHQAVDEWLEKVCPMAEEDADEE